MLSRGSAIDSHSGVPFVYSRPWTIAIHRSQADSSSFISHTAQAWLSVSSTTRFMKTRKKPATSGSRTSRSSASCTASVWMCAMHSARRR